MDGKTIDSVLVDGLCPTGTTFLGVFPRDRIPIHDLTRFPCAYVANTDTHSRPGLHWVAFYHESPTHFEFFDSYGASPDLYGFPLPIKFTGIFYNSHSIQGLFSSVCGEHCIFYLYYRSRKFSLHSILLTLKLTTMPDKFVRIFASHLPRSIFHCCYPHQICLPRYQ